MMTKSRIRAIVFLIGAYILAQAVADVGATKMISLAGVVMPAGSLMFAVTFTLRDLIHKRLGKGWATYTIIAAAIFNVVQSAYLALMTLIPSPDFFPFGEAWGQIFAIVPSITLGSIIAELTSQLIDTEVYEVWRRRFPKAPQWTRVLISNAVSFPVDSLVFGVLAFMVFPLLLGGAAYAFRDAMAVVGGQVVWKAIITVISMPLIYSVKDKCIFDAD